MIKLVLSTDIPGFSQNATVLASILRRTSSPVWVRVYTRGFSYPNFEAGQLKAEFIRCEEEVTGSYPGHVSPAVFDRLRIIRDFDDWDRALVLDHDMLVFCDLAPYFDEPFEGNLLMGRLFGPGNTIGLQLAKRAELPEEWKHCASYPYFYMGPMLNLEAMRNEGIWERLVEAHAAIGQDEQVSLTAACGGRVKGANKKWNLVPAWDCLEEASMFANEAPEEDVVIGDVRWRRGIPEGLIHWTGGAKPWHYRSKVWRADLWETEQCGWEELKTERWNKPASVEVALDDFGRARSLLRRGWKVLVSAPSDRDRTCIGNGATPEAYPDLRFLSGSDLVRAAETSDMVRFGQESKPAEWLKTISTLPNQVVIEGPRNVEEIEALRNLGYQGECRIIRQQWQGGGPHPKVLTYFDPGESIAVAGREDLYLSRSPAEHRPVTPPFSSESTEGVGSQICDELEALIRGGLPPMMPDSPSILELGAGHCTQVLAETFPSSSILSIEHDPEHFRHLKELLSEYSQVKLLHCPLDSTLPWYDLSKVSLPEFDLVVVDGPKGRLGAKMRRSATAIIQLIKPGGLVILNESHRTDESGDRDAWLNLGLDCLRKDDSFTLFQRPSWTLPRPTALGAGQPVELQELAKRCYVISLPDRSDRLEGLRRNWAATSIGLHFEVVDGIRPKHSEIFWQEMKGMEGYGKPDFFRSDYVLGAVGCKRAGIRALRAFIDSQEETALICQDDCRWIHGAPDSIRAALRELPDDWDMVYFSASARSEHQPFSPRLVQLTGARLCTAILWKRQAAIEVLARLEECDCEMDLLMQRVHESMKAYCVVPMPAYQAHSFSNILGDFIKPPNR